MGNFFPRSRLQTARNLQSTLKRDNVHLCIQDSLKIISWILQVTEYIFSLFIVVSNVVVRQKPLS